MTMADQKKVFILGGTKHMINAVEEARQMGMSPIVVEDIVGAPAKEYADKFFCVNAADTEKLTRIAIEENVNGVYTDFEDINTWHAVALCKKAGLPFYFAKKQLASTSSNEKLKDICNHFDVSVIEQYDITVNFEETVLSAWEFPVLIQPLKTKSEIKKSLAT